jgi:hypothetical protein
MIFYNVSWISQDCKILLFSPSNMKYGTFFLIAAASDTLQTLNCQPVTEVIVDASDSTVCSDASLMRFQNENDHSGE